MIKLLFTTCLSFILAFPLTAQKDSIPTGDGDVIMTPIFHATTVLQWKDKTIFMDPYGGADRFASFPDADLICITHAHGDHLNMETLKGLNLANAILIAPQSVADEIDDLNFKEVVVLKNGEDVNRAGINIKAVPMYNLPEEGARHAKGWGNGYVLKIAGKRFYFSGDTEDIPEMRNLKQIDYAFVCMNLPYTMTVEQAADAVLEFKPGVVYPFHYRGKNGFSNVEQFKAIVNSGDSRIEVRLRNWYPE